jgi:hypothetical protein
MVVNAGNRGTLGFILAVGAIGVLALLFGGCTGASSQVAGNVPTAVITPKCSSMSDWPVKAVTVEVKAAVLAYYHAKNLLPVTIDKNREYVLDVVEQQVGAHWCLNPDGTKSGYTGQVPKGATEAVMVYAKHKPYPIIQAPAHFVTLAKSPGTAWKVVGEGTGP